MRFATLSEWLTWQESLHPNPIDLGLERVSAVWQRLATEPLRASVITVAGTNGKGSTVAMLAAVYRAAGYRVASYTSPHLLRYNERIVIDGHEIDDAALCTAFDAVDKARASISLTYFEFGTLAALWLFAQRGLEVIILEVGMGGRLDAVNLIDADVAVITAIDLDHMQWLGETREAIGYEKAGILRPARPAVVSDPKMPASVAQSARLIGAPLYRLQHEYDYRIENGGWRWWSGRQQRSGLARPALSGLHQFQNAAGVIMAIELLQDRHPISAAQLREGLLAARIPGRFEIIPNAVTTVLDVAHNPAGAQQLAGCLAAQPSRCGRTLAVFTALADKDITGLVAPLCSYIDAWYLATADSPRAGSLSELQQTVRNAECGAPIYTANSMAAAYRQALADATDGDWIVVYGSFYGVAEVAKLGL